jgi:hypothetical protein
VSGVANVVGKTEKKRSGGWTGGEDASLSSPRVEKTKNVFHGTQNERKTTVEALHDFAGRFIHSAAAKSAPATARAMEALGV